MNKIGFGKTYSLPLVFCITVISGCGSQQEEWQAMLLDSMTRTENAVKNLETQIRTGNIRNVTLLNRYADVVREQKPELSEIVDAIAEDATVRGPVFQGLKSRWQNTRIEAEQAPQQGEAAVQAVWSELDKIETAARPDVYAMMLTDPINVLADMSDGTLARVAAMSKEASLLANQSSDTGAGSQLIGNPNYGHWRQDSSGGSFWAWYGKYALFSTLFNRRTYYGGWAGGRSYSYYHDYGRDHYTSPSQRREQATVRQRAESKFKRSGKTFRSPYARTKTGAAAGIVKPVPRSARSFKTASAGFRSSYQTRSNSLGSTRNSTYRSSRSYGGGK